MAALDTPFPGGGRRVIDALVAEDAANRNYDQNNSQRSSGHGSEQKTLCYKSGLEAAFHKPEAVQRFPWLRGKDLRIALGNSQCSEELFRNPSKATAIPYFLDLIRLVYHRDATVENVVQAKRFWLAFQRKCTSGDDFPASDLSSEFRDLVSIFRETLESFTEFQLDLPLDTERYIKGLQIFILLGYLEDMGRLFGIPNVDINDITNPTKERLELFGSAAAAFSSFQKKINSAAPVPINPGTLVDLNHRIQKAQEQQQVLREKCEQLEAHEAQLEYETAVLEQEKIRLLKERAALRDDITALEESSDSLKAEMLQYTREHEQLEQERAHLERHILEAQSELVSSPKTVKQEWSFRKSAMEAAKDKIQEETRLVRTATNKQRLLATVINLLTPLVKTFSDLRDCLNEQDRKYMLLEESERRVRKQAAVLEDAESKLLQLTQESNRIISALDAEKHLLEKETVATKKNLKEQRQRENDLESEIISARAQLEAAAKQLSEVTRDLESLAAKKAEDQRTSVQLRDGFLKKVNELFADVLRNLLEDFDAAREHFQISQEFYAKTHTATWRNSAQQAEQQLSQFAERIERLLRDPSLLYTEEDADVQDENVAPSCG